MDRSAHIFPPAPTTADIMLYLLFPCASSILIHHRFLRSVRSQWPSLLGLQMHSCILLPFEEHAPLGHGQPEGDEKSHADNPQSDSVDVEVIKSC